MRVTGRLLLVISLLTAPALVFTSPAAVAQGSPRPVPPDDPARGLVHRDLRPGRPGSLCAGGFEYDVSVPGQASRLSCTHGPDPAPRGVDVRTAVEPVAPGASAAGAPALPCIGNGTDGYRVQVIYARASDKASRYSQYQASFVQWVAEVDEILNASAAETGASQHVRWVTNAACTPVVDNVTMSASGDDSISATASALRSKGYDRSDRHYLVFVDSTRYCGIGNVYVDDRAGSTPGTNYNNGNSTVQGMFGRVDSGCWGSSTAAHEMMHTLGAVQHSAPHSTGGFHCTDESDRLCYDDDGDGPVTTRQVCPVSHEQRFDCNHDDYYHTAPPAGSYLATHWNTAKSAFLTPPVPLSSSSESEAVADFDGNGTTDISVFRPSTGAWYVRNGTTATWGASGDLPVPGDYDGNGTTDIAVFRPATGTWYVRNGTTATWGTTGDIPVPGDYDGNGTTDMAVFRPATGTWFVRNGITSAWGADGDIAVPGDYDGNGTTDIAVFRPSTGTWFVRNGTTAAWGASGDIPVPGDYDGNGTTDIAVFRPATGTWFVRTGTTAAWGTSGDIPVPGDYDGSGTTDIAVVRPATGTWFVRNGVSVAWGADGDVAVPLPAAIRLSL